MAEAELLESEPNEKKEPLLKEEFQPTILKDKDYEHIFNHLTCTMLSCLLKEKYNEVFQDIRNKHGYSADGTKECLKQA